MPDVPAHAVVPLDQADGLRRRFGAAGRVRFVPLVSNPYLAFGGVIIERLVAAFGAARVHTLVVDAADNAPPPHEIAGIDLAEAVEPLSRHASYLAARGLPRRHVDSRGSSASLLRALSEAVPQADVVLVHAGASELWRLFAQHAVRPIVLASDHPAAVTHAYAGIKLLALRAGLMTHDLLLGAATASPRAGRIAMQIAACAELFVGATQRGWAPIDPAADAELPPSPSLCRLAGEALQPTDVELPATAPARH